MVLETLNAVYILVMLAVLVKATCKAVLLLSMVALFVRVSFLYTNAVLSKELKRFDNPNKGLSYKELKQSNEMSYRAMRQKIDGLKGLA